jgi:hypothetical protein
MEQPENRKVGREAKESDEEEKWVRDSSVDYKGRVPLRSSTGVWTASLFIISKCNLFVNVSAMKKLVLRFLLKCSTDLNSLHHISSLLNSKHCYLFS